MKNNKMQFLLCLVISVLCWSSSFGQVDSLCLGYQIEVSAEPTTLYMNIYNPTDFGPYTPNVVEWYSPDWELEFGDSATVVYELDINFPPSFEMLICADYEVDGDFCTACESVFVSDVNECEYELNLETQGMIVFGSVVNTVHNCPPVNVTWILEGGGGVISNDSILFYQFDEVGEYTICAEYSDNILGCEGVICDMIVVEAEQEDCNFEMSINVGIGGIYAGIYDADGPNNYPEEASWTIDGIHAVDGSALEYDFDLEEGNHLVCVEYNDGPDCMGMLCDSVFLGDVNISGCPGFHFDYEMEGDWGIFTLNYATMYELDEDSISWYIDGQFVEHGNPIDYNFPTAGIYTICATTHAYNTLLDEVCGAEVCFNVSSEDQAQNTCETDFEIQYFTEDSSGYFYLYNSNNDISFDSTSWYIDGQLMPEYGIQMDYDFPTDGVYTVCATAWNIWNVATGEPCPPTQTCIDVEIDNQQNDCGFIEISPTVDGDWGLFEVFYPELYQINDDSVAWYINDQFVEYGIPMDYNFPADGVYTVCALALSIWNVVTGEVCPPVETCIDVEIVNQQNNCEAFFEWQDNGSINDINTVTFANVSAGNYTDVMWDFGDGNTSTYSSENSFEHIYEDVGVYNVCLTVLDTLGCQSTYCEVVLVSGTPGECDFEVEYDQLNDSLFIFTLTSSTGISGNAAWLNPETGEDYGTGDMIVLVFDDFGEYEVCAYYETVANVCWGEICTTVTVENSPCEDTDCVFPGDTDRDMIANNYDVLPIGLHFGQTGPLRPDATIDWYGQPAPDWQASADSVNLKHVDCNGDGEIHFDDIDAIEQNYNRIHDGVNAMRVEGAPGLHLEFDIDTIYSVPDTGTLIINADIIIGTMDLPVEELYGIAFSIGYPADLVDSNTVAADYFVESWLGDPTMILQLEKNVHDESVIDFAYSRTDQQNISGFGQVGTASFVMTDNIIGKLASETELNFPITNVRAINNMGEEIAVTGSENTITVNLENTTTTTHNPDLSQNINIFPNPTSNTISMTIKDLQAQTVALYNAVGQRVLARQIKTDTQLDVSRLPSGVYLISIQTDKGVYSQKLVIGN